MFIYVMYNSTFLSNQSSKIKYSIYLNDSDSSFGQKEPDQLIEKYEIDVNGVKINIKEYLIKGKDSKRYVAEFEYRDVNYQLKGSMDKREFDEIIKNFIFL